MGPELLVLPPHPPDEDAVQVGKYRVDGRLTEAGVVVDPAVQDWVHFPRDVLQRGAVAILEFPAPHLLAHLRLGLVADSRVESYEESS